MHSMKPSLVKKKRYRANHYQSEQGGTVKQGQHLFDRIKLFDPQSTTF